MNSNTVGVCNTHNTMKWHITERNTAKYPTYMPLVMILNCRQEIRTTDQRTQRIKIICMAPPFLSKSLSGVAWHAKCTWWRYDSLIVTAIHDSPHPLQIKRSECLHQHECTRYKPYTAKEWKKCDKRYTLQKKEVRRKIHKWQFKSSVIIINWRYCIMYTIEYSIFLWWCTAILHLFYHKLTMLVL